MNAKGTGRLLVAISSIVVACVALGAAQPGRQRRASEAADYAQAVEDLVAANRILTREGIFEGYGHVSVRHPGNPNRFLISRSIAPGLVTAKDIVECDLDSKLTMPNSPATYSERFIHGEIYKMRADVKAVVHNHSPSVIPFGLTGVALRPVYHMASFVGAGIPVYDIREASGATDMLVSDAARGRALAAVLGMKPAALMRGHGAAVVGMSIPQVVGRSIYLSLNATIQLQAMQLGAAVGGTAGGTVKYLDAGETEKALGAGDSTGYPRDWDLWKSRMK
jgi:HCOMODA/2-hydroxy-3-carboxy-muconic semialdehyde decarboxylase